MPKKTAGKATRHGRAGRVLHATDRDFDRKVAAAAGAVLVDLWAPWCQPCQMLGPVLEKLAGRLAGRITVIKVDVDKCPATAERFGVNAIPTLVLLSGGRLSKRTGLRPLAELEAWLERATRGEKR